MYYILVPIGKASRPDVINNRVFKELADQLATHLCSLFNQSINDGCVPEIWKVAHAKSIPNNGDRSLASNHRPISLLSNIDKLFESIFSYDRRTKHKLNLFFFKCKMILSPATYYPLYPNLLVTIQYIIYESHTITLQFTVEHNTIIQL